MVSIVEHAERGIVGIHRTFLRKDGSGKADLPRDWQKLAKGPIGGGAVRLAMPRPGEWLAVTEGIETALSIIAACGLPAWAALSAGGLRSIVLPPEVAMVLICGDNDANGVGQRALHEACDRFLSEGRRVRIAIPPEPDTDFNDLLLNHNSKHFKEEQKDVAA
jgi:putative DNA primase/helicase